MPNSKTYKIGLDGKVSDCSSPIPSAATARRSGPDGRLYAVAGGAEQISPTTTDGKAKVIAEGFRGNDLVVRHDGGIYVTQPGWDGKSRSKVWYIKPAGRKEGRRHGSEVLPTALRSRPINRCCTSPTAKSHWVYSYQIQPDGSLADKQKLLSSARARHGRRFRGRRHARRSRRPALCRDADGHSGLRSGRPRELHHPDAQRQV